jgi:hypothetical protein
LRAEKEEDMLGCVDRPTLGCQHVRTRYWEDGVAWPGVELRRITLIQEERRHRMVLSVSGQREEGTVEIIGQHRSSIVSDLPEDAEERC